MWTWGCCFCATTLLVAGKCVCVRDGVHCQFDDGHSIYIDWRQSSGAAVAEGFDWEFLVKHYLYIRWWMLRLAMDHGPSERRERRGHRHINLPVAQHHRQYIFSTPLPMPAFTFTRPLLKIACGVCFWWTAQGTRTTTTPIVTITISLSITIIRSNTLSTLCLLLLRWWWKW